MAMDKINGSPLLRQGILDRFRGAERGAGQAGTNPGGATDPSTAPTADKADISDAARRLIDLRQAVDTGRRALAELPDVRPEKVAAARERLATGFYNAVEVRDAVAERLAGVVAGIDNL